MLSVVVDGFNGQLEITQIKRRIIDREVEGLPLLHSFAGTYPQDPVGKGIHTALAIIVTANGCPKTVKEWLPDG
jgi:hypothetical protein